MFHQNIFIPKSFALLSGYEPFEYNYIIRNRSFDRHQFPVSTSPRFVLQNIVEHYFVPPSLPFSATTLFSLSREK